MGTDVAIETADVALMGDDLRQRRRGLCVVAGEDVAQRSPSYAARRRSAIIAPGGRHFESRPAPPRFSDPRFLHEAWEHVRRSVVAHAA